MRLTNKLSVLLLGLIILLGNGCKDNATVVSDLEGNQYAVRQFDGSLWMMENLRSQRDNQGNEITYFFPNGDSSNVEQYGLLYDYETACKVCPEGWTLPDNDDWDRLLFQNKDSLALSFKEVAFWGEMQNTNESQFSVRPTGYGNNGEFDNFFNVKTYFWSKTGHAEHIWTYIFEKGKDKIRKAEQHSTYAYSVRCIKKNMR